MRPRVTLKCQKINKHMFAIYYVSTLYLNVEICTSSTCQCNLRWYCSLVIKKLKQIMLSPLKYFPNSKLYQRYGKHSNMRRTNNSALSVIWWHGNALKPNEHFLFVSFESLLSTFRSTFKFCAHTFLSTPHKLPLLSDFLIHP